MEFLNLNAAAVLWLCRQSVKFLALSVYRLNQLTFPVILAKLAQFDFVLILGLRLPQLPTVVTYRFTVLAPPLFIGKCLVANGFTR